MLSPSQERLIRWLGRFSRDLNQAWDVPREVSLPGLSEAMGVVRSALHAPLKELVELDLLETRLAHVSGGGARRRNVYHLTAAGWNYLASLPAEENPAGAAAKRGLLSGNAAPLIAIIGRDEEVGEVVTSIENSGCVVVTGLPGIGKTSLLRAVAEELIDSGKDVAWARCTQFDDSSALLSGAFDGREPPSDPAAAVDWLCRKIGRGVLIIDELQEIHSRHRAAILSLIDEIIERGPNLIIACRAPSLLASPKPIIIGELDEETALNLLGDEVDAELGAKVIASLGGHPLALKLHDPDSDYDTIGRDISQFIEQTVLDSLPEDCIDGLDELAAMPLPVGADRLRNDAAVGVLDDHALLRWSDEDASAVELQHLVRQVRREMWDEETARRVHAAAAERWAEHPESEARFVEFHHRLQADDEDVAAFITLHADDLGNCDDGALAALLHDGIDKRPEVDALWYLATKTALDRGESEVVEELFSQMPNPDTGTALALRARQALQQGRREVADALQEEAAATGPPEDRIRIVISHLARILDDRLPHGMPVIPSAEIKRRLAEVKLTEIGADTRQRALVAIATIQHRLALLEQDYSAAKKVRQQLGALTDESDPLLTEMALSAALEVAKWDTPDWHRESEAMRRHMTSSPPLRALSLRLTLVEKIAEHDAGEARKLLDDAGEELPAGPTARRLQAKLWYWRGVLDSVDGLEYWREAIHRYRAAECAHAAQELTQKMHQMLR
ncbi:MAG TPA: ATP-binding protein [Candidatus Poseidoniales archaeon]|nr:ATP-binding protein [Candidatus Poseidoniales archaeon]